MPRCLRAAVVAGAIVAAAVPPAGASAQVGVADARDIALDYVRDNAGDLGTTRADVAELTVMSSYRSSHNRVTHVTVNQRQRGLEVFGASATVSIAADGRVIFAGGSLVRGVKGGADSARLGYQSTGDGLRLAYHLTIDDTADEHLWSAIVDAATGKLLAKDDLTDHDNLDQLAERVGGPRWRRSCNRRSRSPTARATGCSASRWRA